MQSDSYFTTINIVWRCENASVTSGTFFVTQLNHKRATSHTSCRASEAFLSKGEEEEHKKKKSRPRQHAGFIQGESQPRSRTRLPPSLPPACCCAVAHNWLCPITSSCSSGGAHNLWRRGSAAPGCRITRNKIKVLRKANGAGGDLVWCQLASRASARVRCSPPHKVTRCFVRCLTCVFCAGRRRCWLAKLRELGEQIGGWWLWESEVMAGWQVWSWRCLFHLKMQSQPN